MNSPAIKERPILFTGPMVRAILDGRKTQTRRIVKPQPDVMYEYKSNPELLEFLHATTSGTYSRDSFARHCCKYGKPGDRLWVRETHAHVSKCGHYNHLHGLREWIYKATDEECGPKWTPSIHMLRVASRIDLEITGIRVERLQDITEEDAIAEGIEVIRPGLYAVHGSSERTQTGSARKAYMSLWESINGPGSWAANPWVWVVEFRNVP